MKFKKYHLFFGLITAAMISCKHSDKNKQEEIGLEKDQAVVEKADISDNTAQEEGKAIYSEYCVTCHQANGSGVPHLNPPLQQTEYVLGGKDSLIRILLNGSSEGLEIKGKIYSNNMPAFNNLSDQQIADVLTYVRGNFGNDAEAISASEVKAVREKQ